MTYVCNVKTLTISNHQLLLSFIWLLQAQIIHLSCNMICSSTISIPTWINHCIWCGHVDCCLIVAIADSRGWCRLKVLIHSMPTTKSYVPLFTTNLANRFIAIASARKTFISSFASTSRVQVSFSMTMISSIFMSSKIGR